MSISKARTDMSDGEVPLRFRLKASYDTTHYREYWMQHRHTEIRYVFDRAAECVWRKELGIALNHHNVALYPTHIDST